MISFLAKDKRHAALKFGQEKKEIQFSLQPHFELTASHESALDQSHQQRV